MTESTIGIVRYYTAIVKEIMLTCVDNGCISFQHLETSAAPDICTFCKNSTQMGELPGTEEERKTRRCDFGLEFQKDTIYTWTSMRSMHEQHWLYVAIWYQYRCRSNSGVFLPWCCVLRQESDGGNLLNVSHLQIGSIIHMVKCVLGVYVLSSFTMPSSRFQPFISLRYIDSNPESGYGN